MVLDIANEVLDTRKVAALLDSTPTYITELARSGKLTGRRIGSERGGIWIFALEDVETFKANRASNGR